MFTVYFATIALVFMMQGQKDTLYDTFISIPHVLCPLVADEERASYDTQCTIEYQSSD